MSFVSTSSASSRPSLTFSPASKYNTSSSSEVSSLRNKLAALTTERDELSTRST